MANLLSTTVNGSLLALNNGVTNAYTTASNGRLFLGSSAQNDYSIYTHMEDFGGNYTKLTLDWHTGIKIGASKSYGGIRFYSDSITNDGVKLFSIGEGDSNVRVVNTLFIGGNTAIHAGNIGSQSVSVARQLLSPNDATVVAADSAMPSAGHSFIHTLALGPGGNDGHILGMTWAGTTSIYGAQIFLDTDPTDTMAIRSRSNAGVWTSWKTVIHSGNIASQSVSYADESGYSGSTGSVEWTNVNSRPTALSQFTNDSGYITGVTNISGYANNLYSQDIRTIAPNTHGAYRLNFGFTSWNNNNTAPWADYIHLRSYSDGSGGSDNLITFLKSGIGMRIWQQSFASGTAYSSYVDVITSGNIGGQSVSYASSAGNADTLDGLNSSVFVRNDTYNSADAGLQVFRNIGTIDGSWPSSDHTFGLENNDAGNIVVNFHRGGYTSHNLWYNGSQFRFDQVVTSTADMRAPIFYDSQDTGYYVDPNGTSNLSRVLIPNASSGASLIVGINNTSRVIDDNARKGLVVNADYYPHIYVNALSSASNDVHGAVISMTGVLSAGGYRRWGMGIANTDPSALSWGWWDNESNPHYSVGGTLGYTSTGSRMWLDTGGNLQTTGSMRAPIFYDSNDTTYYLDPNGSISGIFAGSVGINNTSPINTAWGNASTTKQLSIDGTNYALINLLGGSRRFSMGVGDAQFYMCYDNTAGRHNIIVNSSGNVTAAVDFRAPIFYDSADTNYYVDPNSNSKLVNLGLGGATPDLRLSVSGDIHMDGYIYQGGTAGVVNSWGSRTLVSSGSYVSNARSFAFNNVGYGSSWTFAIASDGAVTTNRHIDANTTWTNSATTLFLGWYGGKVVIGNNNEANHDNAAGLGGNTIAITNTLYSFEQSNLYYDGSLKLYMGSDGTRNTGWAYHTNNGTGLHWPNNGWHIYPVNASDMYIRSGASDCSLKFTKLGESGSYVHCSADNDIGFLTTGRSWSLRVDNSGNAFATSSFRAPIFYDSDDTGYYLDPNGTSNLIQLTNNTRARWGMPRWWNDRSSFVSDQNYWTGTNGWGTGQGTWANAWKGGFSGWDIWGEGSDHPQGAGYVHAQGIVSGQHYASSDGSIGYGWMMVGAGDATANRYWLRGKWGGTTSGWTEMMTSNQNPIAWNMDQYVRTSDSVSFNSTTSPTFLVNSHSDNTKGYRIHNTSGSSVSAMFTNSSNQLVIAAGAVDQINLNKKVYVNGVALGVNVAPSGTAGRIDASNDIVAYSSSDERLKHNITPIENALDKVKSLTGVEFDWKPEYKHAHGYEGHDTGIIAQQVQEVIPSAVRTNDTGFLAVRYEKLIGLLVEGMKEQQAQIEELKAKLDGITK
jgi:hypothetical protein